MSRSLSSEVACAVAKAKGTDPTDLDYRLQEHIDTLALNRLATHENASWTLSFDLPDQNVTVTDDGLIIVDGDCVETWS